MVGVPLSLNQLCALSRKQKPVDLLEADVLVLGHHDAVP